MCSSRLVRTFPTPSHHFIVSNYSAAGGVIKKRARQCFLICPLIGAGIRALEDVKIAFQYRNSMSLLHQDYWQLLIQGRENM